MSLRPRLLSVAPPPPAKTQGALTLRFSTDAINGTMHQHLEELEQQLNTAVEDATGELDNLVAVLKGKIKGIMPCPSLTTLNALRIAQRLDDVVERVDGLKKIIEELGMHAGDDPRYVGPGVLQMD